MERGTSQLAEASQYRVAVFGVVSDKSPETRARILGVIEKALLPLQAEGIYVNTAYFQFDGEAVKVHDSAVDG